MYYILFLHSISRYLKQWEGNVLCRTVDPDCSQIRKKWKISPLQTIPGRKISIFKFPKDECMLQKWIKVIPREGDHWATSYNGVCELHFQKEDFFNPDSNMHGNCRQRSAIIPEAIPRTFPNCPKYLSKERPTLRSENTSAKARHENQMKRLEEAEQVFNIIDQVSTLTDLIQKLPGEKLPDGFRIVEMSLSDGEIALSLRIEKVDMTIGMPIISHNLTIFSDLHFKLHQDGIDITVKRMNDITKVSGAIGRVSDVPNILARLKNLNPNEENLIENAVRILDKIEFNSESSSDARIQVATLAVEQLRLSLVNPHQRRYSSKL